MKYFFSILFCSFLLISTKAQVDENNPKEKSNRPPASKIFKKYLDVGIGYFGYNVIFLPGAEAQVNLNLLHVKRFQLRLLNRAFYSPLGMYGHNHSAAIEFNKFAKEEFCKTCYKGIYYSYGFENHYVSRSQEWRRFQQRHELGLSIYKKDNRKFDYYLAGTTDPTVDAFFIIFGANIYFL